VDKKGGRVAPLMWLRWSARYLSGGRSIQKVAMKGKDGNANVFHRCNNVLWISGANQSKDDVKMEG